MSYDLIVLGKGPAGISAAIYAKRYNMKVLVIGSQPSTISESGEVSNYMGYPSISGIELSDKFEEHAKELEIEIITEKITKIEKNKDNFFVFTEQGKYESRTLVYALGGVKRKSGLENEKDFIGRGISYCATCDGAFFKDKIVAVTGGSNSAATSAILLSNIAKKVYVVYRRDSMRCFPFYEKKIRKKENVEVIFNSNIVKIKGDKLLESAVVRNITTGEETELDLDGIFVEFGYTPNFKLAKEFGVKVNDKGRIIVGDDMSTNIDCFFAAGDVTDGSNSFDQVVTAASEGAIASQSAYKKISESD